MESLAFPVLYESQEIKKRFLSGWFEEQVSRWKLNNERTGRGSDRELPGPLEVPGKRYVAEASALTALQHRSSLTVLGAYDAAAASTPKGCLPTISKSFARPDRSSFAVHV